MPTFKHHARFLGALALGVATAHAQDSKKGFAFIGDTHAPDNKLLSTSNGPIKWYYVSFACLLACGIQLTKRKLRTGVPIQMATSYPPALWSSSP
jgi:hypothetical protein